MPKSRAREAAERFAQLSVAVPYVALVALASLTVPSMFVFALLASLGFPLYFGALFLSNKAAMRLLTEHFAAIGRAGRSLSAPIRATVRRASAPPARPPPGGKGQEAETRGMMSPAGPWLPAGGAQAKAEDRPEVR